MAKPIAAPTQAAIIFLQLIVTPEPAVAGSSRFKVQSAKFKFKYAKYIIIRH
jgi:hypothetical protein